MAVVRHVPRDMFIMAMDHSMNDENTVKMAELCGPHYEVVARVESEDLDQIYELTNSIFQSWVKNDKVAARNPEGCRSTSIGDIITLDNGKSYVVASVGFKEINVPRGFRFN